MKKMIRSGMRLGKKMSEKENLNRLFKTMGYLMIVIGGWGFSFYSNGFISVLGFIIAPIAIGMGVGMVEKYNDLLVYSIISGFVLILGVGVYALVSMVLVPSLEKLVVMVIAIPVSSYWLYTYYRMWKPDLIDIIYV